MAKKRGDQAANVANVISPKGDNKQKPTRFKDAEIAAALQAVDGNMTLAAKRLKCSRMTISRRVKEKPELQDIVASGREELVDLGEYALRKAVLDGEKWAVQYVLGTLGQNRGYGEQVKHEHAGPGGAAIPMAITYNTLPARTEPPVIDDDVMLERDDDL